MTESSKAQSVLRNIDNGRGSGESEFGEDSFNGHIVSGEGADVSRTRERSRLRRIGRLAVLLIVLAAWMAYRHFTGNPISFGLPGINPTYAPAFIIVMLLAPMLVLPMLLAGKSPHVMYRPNEIPVGLDDVRGARVVREEVIRTLNLFRSHQTFQEKMGGTPRRGVLFEGPPGTGKTFMAKAMAREAGVPFLFVSSSAFQSMYYGQTNRKIRSYFRELRKVARREGGAVGFIEEIDAIGGSRAGMGGGGEGVTGVVNELLIQLQSFDEPTTARRLMGRFVDGLNRLLPAHRQMRKPTTPAANVLILGATNRADDLDPALVRPGRFDRTIRFDLPGRADRLDILDYYLAKKAHDDDLDRPERREALAAATFGYSPVMLEHLLDEALVWALRRGAEAFDWADVQQAKMTEELGLRQPVDYTADERHAIATHEAGHATVAWLVGTHDGRGGPVIGGRRLEVLSIVKRRDALGMLAHSDTEERFTKTRSEMESQIQIALGGMGAEQLLLGETGTGPAGDLKTATETAAAMIGAYGMGSSLVSFYAATNGGDGLVATVLADDSARSEVEMTLREARADVERKLTLNRHILEALRDALLARDELVGEEIIGVIAEAEKSNRVIDLRDRLGTQAPVAE